IDQAEQRIGMLFGSIRQLIDQPAEVFLRQFYVRVGGLYRILNAGTAHDFADMGVFVGPELEET
ncbi:hypothetical protein ABTL68_19920, partial [Acinetobacter baumannii]